MSYMEWLGMYNMYIYIILYHIYIYIYVNTHIQYDFIYYIQAIHARRICSSCCDSCLGLGSEDLAEAELNRAYVTRHYQP